MDLNTYVFNKNQFCIKKEKFFNKYVFLSESNNNIINNHINNVNNLHKNINLILGNSLKYLNKNFYFQNINFAGKKQLYLKYIKNNMPFKLYIFDYYQITNVERVSKIMTNCSNTLNKNYNNFLK
jgi:hypothetical protein